MKDQKITEASSPRPPHGLPWWLYILLAIGSYCMLKYVVPGIPLSSPVFHKFFQAAPTFAPLVTILFLLLGAKRLYDIDRQEEEPNPADIDDMQNPQE